MTDPAKAIASQLANIEKRSGKTLAELSAALRASGLAKHAELRTWAQSEFGLGYGDANTLVHHAKGDASALPPAAAGAAPAGTAAAPAAQGAGGGAGTGGAAGEEAVEAVDTLYVGPKAGLRPLHDAVMARLAAFGAFEIAPKKTYLSLRRKKQFAMLGPATKTQVEIGLNMKGVPGTERLVEQAPGGMCNYKVRLGSVGEVDGELLGWLRVAYDSAG